jgi:hypothetical protein
VIIVNVFQLHKSLLILRGSLLSSLPSDGACERVKLGPSFVPRSNHSGLFIVLLVLSWVAPLSSVGCLASGLLFSPARMRFHSGLVI